MARNVIVQRFDDLDGAPLDDGPSTSFGLAGKTYEIDLSEKNVEKLRAALAPFVQAARRTQPRRRTRAR